MRYSYIPYSDLKISLLSLGSMTFGEQIQEKEAYLQLDYAIDHGINMIDSAEIYPVPYNKKTQGLSEKIIGNWLKKNKIQRNKLILATKIAGPPRKKNTYVRKNQKLNYKNIHSAINSSLKRLKTDYIDLYQIHWPQRTTNNFGKLNYKFIDNEIITVSLFDTLEALNKEIKSGKIRYVGISNETPWGAYSYLKLSEKYNLPRIITIQNPYNLLNRSFEIGLSEISKFEKLKLIAYSSLAFGNLTGKYLNDSYPPKSRKVLYKNYFTRYNSEKAQQAISKYVSLAKLHELDPAKMAISFVHKQPFVASVILGVSSIEQLKSNIQSIKLNLNDQIIKSIEEIHEHFTIPSP